MKLNSKLYAIVGFPDEDNIIEMVPTKWLINENLARWPETESRETLKQCIQNCIDPKDSWKIVQIKIYSFASK